MNLKINKQTIKKYLIALSTGLLLSTTLIASDLPSPQPTDQPIDSIIAVVNDDVITTSELNQAINITKQQILASHMKMPDDSVIKKNILDSLIYEKLQLQLAERSNISASQQDIDQAIANIAKNKNISITELKQQAKQSGLSEKEFNTQIKNQTTLQKLQQAFISPTITVTSADIAKAKTQLNQQSAQATQYQITDILLPLSATASTSEVDKAITEAKTIAQQIQQGKDINSINGIEVNDMGWTSENKLPDLFINTLKTMKDNDISSPIKASNGIHILKLSGKKTPAASQNQDDKMAYQLAFQTKFNDALSKWLKKLYDSAYIKKTTL